MEKRESLMSLGIFPCPRKKNTVFYAEKKWVAQNPPSFLFPRKTYRFEVGQVLWLSPVAEEMHFCYNFESKLHLPFLSPLFFEPPYTILVHTYTYWPCTGWRQHRGRQDRVSFPPSINISPPWKERVLRSIKGRGIFRPQPWASERSWKGRVDVLVVLIVATATSYKVIHMKWQPPLVLEE